MTISLEENFCPLCGCTELEPCAVYNGRPIEVSAPNKETLHYNPGSGLFRCVKCRVPLPEEFRWNGKRK
jgi:hypothetical protein